MQSFHGWWKLRIWVIGWKLSIWDHFQSEDHIKDEKKKKSAQKRRGLGNKFEEDFIK